MSQWVQNLIDSPSKPAFPILSQPATQLLHVSVRDLLYDSSLRAQGMKLISELTPMPIAFSLMDLSVEAECFGAKALYAEHEMPLIFEPLITCREDAEVLEIPEVGSGRSRVALDTATKALQLITDRPVFASITGPFSLTGCLMGISETMIYCLDDPDMVDTVLEKATAFLMNLCLAYKKLGVHGVFLAEPLTGLISPLLAEKFSARYVKLLVNALQDDSFIFLYHNCGNFAGKQIDSIVSTGAKMLHFGNSIHMEELLKHIPEDIAVLGNIDPASQFRNGTPASIYKKTTQLLQNCSGYKNFILSSGCDIPSMSSLENIRSFFQAAEDFYNPKRQSLCSA